DPGGDGMTARGKLAQDTRVEVAIKSERECARNRRGRQMEDVWHQSASCLLVERGPLVDAEPVLLVDDDQRQPVEIDFLFDQGVRADEQTKLTCSQSLEKLPPLARRR